MTVCSTIGDPDCQVCLLFHLFGPILKRTRALILHTCPPEISTFITNWDLNPTVSDLKDFVSF